MKLFFF